MDIENRNDYKIYSLIWEETEKLYHTNMQQDFPAPEIKPFGMIEELYRRGLNQAYQMRLWYMHEDEICTIIDVEERKREEQAQRTHSPENPYSMWFSD